jgi:hypothetical protein
MEKNSNNATPKTRSPKTTTSPNKRPKRGRMRFFIAVILLITVVIIAPSIFVLNLWMKNGGLSKTANEFCKSMLDPSCQIADIRATLDGRVRIAGIKIVGSNAPLSPPGADKSLLTIDEIRLVFNWTSIFRLAIEIDELFIESPRVEVDCAEGRCNYSAIAERIASNQNKQASPKGAEVSHSQLVKQISKTNLPIALRIGRLGFSKANLRIKDVNGTVQRDFSVQDASLNLSAAVNLPRAEIGIDASFEQITTGASRIAGQNLRAKLLAELNSPQNRISIPEFAIDLGKILNFKLNASLAANGPQSGLAEASGHAELKLDISNLRDSIGFLIPQMSFSGAADIAVDMPAQVLDLDNIVQFYSARLPALKADLKLEDLSVIFGPTDRLHASVENISTKLSVQTKKRDLGVSEIELDGGIEIPAAFLSAKNAIGDLKIQKTKLDLTAILAPFEKKIPQFNLMFSNGDISLVSKGRALASTNLLLNLKGKLSDEIEAELDLNLAKLARVSVSGSAKQSEGDIDAKLEMNLADLARIESFAKPIVESVGFVDLPKSISGAMAAKLSIKGKDLYSLRYHAGEIFKSPRAEFDLSSDIRLSKISLTDSLRIGSIKNLNLDWMVEATPGKQNARIDMQSEIIQIGQNILRASKIDALDLSQSSLHFKMENLFAKNRMIVSSAKTAISLEHKTESVKLTSQKQEYQSSLEIALNAIQQSTSVVKIQNFEVKLPSFGAKAGIQGGVSLNTKLEPQSVEAALNFELANVASLGVMGDIQTSGSMRASVSGQSDLRSAGKIDGRLDFENLDIQIGGGSETTQTKIVGLTGTFPFRQQFAVENLRRAMDLLDTRRRPDAKKTETTTESLQSRMQRYLDARSSTRIATSAVVDYKSQKPASGEDLQLRVNKIIVKGFEANNVNFDLEIKQNYLSLNEFNAQILGGSVQGSTFVAFNELNPEVDATLHFTGLNTRNLLNDFPAVKKRAANWNLLADPYVGGAVNLKVDLVNREINGRMDLTQIGLEQVRMLLYYLDPNQKDPSIKTVIQILNAAKLVAGIERVSVPIESGLIDVIIQMRLAGAPIPLPKIQQFPLGKLISNIVTEKLQKVDATGNTDAH